MLDCLLPTLDTFQMATNLVDPDQPAALRAG